MWLWTIVPPPGFVSLGVIATTSEAKPPLTLPLRCVLRRMVREIPPGKLAWADQGSKSEVQATFWDVTGTGLCKSLHSKGFASPTEKYYVPSGEVTPEPVVKVCVVGDRGVGKTTQIGRLSAFKATNTYANGKQKITTFATSVKGVDVKAELWDNWSGVTAGELNVADVAQSQAQCNGLYTSWGLFNGRRCFHHAEGSRYLYWIQGHWVISTFLGAPLSMAKVRLRTDSAAEFPPLPEEQGKMRWQYLSGSGRWVATRKIKVRVVLQQEVTFFL